MCATYSAAIGYEWRVNLLAATAVQQPIGSNLLVATAVQQPIGSNVDCRGLTQPEVDRRGAQFERAMILHDNQIKVQIEC